MKKKRLITAVALLLCVVLTAVLAEETAPSADPPSSTSPPSTEAPKETPSPTDPPQATEEPRPTDTPAPSAEPEETATPQPEATPAPSDEPSATETPAPGPKLSVSVRDAVKNGKTYIYTYQNESDTFLLTWNTSLSDAVFSVRITGENTDVMQSTGTSAQLSLNVRDYLKGTYTAEVTASDGETSLSAGIQFLLVKAGETTPTPAPTEGPQPTDTPSPADDPSVTPTPSPADGPETSPEPSPSPTGFPWKRRRWPKGFGGFGDMTAEVGFHVTPGKALTSDHSKGNREEALFGTISLETVDGEMKELVLGGEALPVILDNAEHAFLAAVEENSLVLTPAGEGTVWQVGQDALRVLSDSGIDTLLLLTDSGSVEVETNLDFSGRVYASLRAEGMVSKDFLLNISFGSLLVSVEEDLYSVNEQLELQRVSE